MLDYEGQRKYPFQRILGRTQSSQAHNTYYGPTIFVHGNINIDTTLTALANAIRMTCVHAIIAKIERQSMGMVTIRSTIGDLLFV